MSLHVTTAGKGPRLVMLHGWGLNSRVWDSILPRLSERFTTVCIDLPGHGASPWPPKFHDIDSLAQLIEPYLAEGTAPNPLPQGERGQESSVSKDGCLLLGWSLGAMAALALASKRSNRIRRLVLVAATPKFLMSRDWPHGVEPQALNSMATRVITDFHATVRDFLLWQVHGDEHARPALKVLRDKVRAAGEPNPEALRAGLETLSSVDLRPRLPAIDIPTLVISGERDRLSHPDAGKALANSLPRAQFHLMERAAHAPFLSHEDEFCAEVMDFLSGKTPLPPTPSAIAHGLASRGQGRGGEAA